MVETRRRLGCGDWSEVVRIRIGNDGDLRLGTSEFARDVNLVVAIPLFELTRCDLVPIGIDQSVVPLTRLLVFVGGMHRVPASAGAGTTVTSSVSQTSSSRIRRSGFLFVGERQGDATLATLHKTAPCDRSDERRRVQRDSQQKCSENLRGTIAEFLQDVLGVLGLLFVSIVARQRERDRVRRRPRVQQDRNVEEHRTAKPDKVCRGKDPKR